MVKLSQKLVLSLMVVSFSVIPAISSDLTMKSSAFGGSKNAPQDAKGVVVDCQTRIKMVEGKEGLFKAPPKPLSPFKLSQWRKDVADVEAKKSDYREDIKTLHEFFAAEKAKIEAGSPADPKFSATFQEMYSNCKRFTDGIASKVSKAAGITPYKQPVGIAKK